MVELLSNNEKTGNVEVVRLLYERGADINAKLYNGYSPLHWAMSRGNNFPKSIRK